MFGFHAFDCDRERQLASADAFYFATLWVYGFESSFNAADMGLVL